MACFCAFSWKICDESGMQYVLHPITFLALSASTQDSEYPENAYTAVICEILWNERYIPFPSSIYLFYSKMSTFA